MGWFALGGAVLGGLLNRSSTRSANNTNVQLSKEAFERSKAHEREIYQRTKADQLTQFVRLREAAEKAGLNPLTALGSGANMVPGGSSIAMGAASVAPALVSTDALANGFQSLGDELTGKNALDRAEQTARTDLMRVQADVARAGGAVSRIASAPGAASLRVGGAAPAVMSAGPRQPSLGPFNSTAPRDTTPVLLSRNDGMTSANFDAPTEPEVDLWAWGRDGSLFENLEEMTKRNYAGFARATSAPARALFGIVGNTAVRVFTPRLGASPTSNPNPTRGTISPAIK